MSTIEDFENAPVGSIAKKGLGLGAIREGDKTYVLPWVCTTYGEWLSNEELAERGYVLDPPAPTTAREALDLAWNLAHPVKMGQTIPAGMTYFARYLDGTTGIYTPVVDRNGPLNNPPCRTLDPLPEPEPDWLDAPAVLAATILEDRSKHRTVFARENKTGTQWLRDTKVYRWDELIDVVPLYPKGQDA